MKNMELTVIPIKSERKSKKFDLFEEICKSLKNTRISLQNYDVLVISSKFISQSDCSGAFWAQKKLCSRQNER